MVRGGGGVCVRDRVRVTMVVSKEKTFLTTAAAVR